MEPYDPNVFTIDNGVLKRFNRPDWYEVHIPDGVVKIGYSAFGYGFNKDITSQIRKIYMPDSVMEIDNAVFYGNKNLNEIRLSKNLKKIGDEAFIVTGLKELFIPKSVKEIGRSIMHSSQSFERFIVEQGNEHFVSVDGVLFDINKTTLLEYPANKASNKFDVPSSVSLIKIHAFQDARILQEISFNNEDLYIEYGTFNFANNLRVININTNRIKGIATQAFNICPNLKTINFNGTYREWKKLRIKRKFWTMHYSQEYEEIDGKKVRKVATLKCLDKTKKIKPHIFRDI